MHSVHAEIKRLHKVSINMLYAVFYALRSALKLAYSNLEFQNVLWKDLRTSHFKGREGEGRERP
jgi:hypothetical protein